MEKPKEALDRQEVFAREIPSPPYLFIICTEGLIAQIKNAEWFGKIQGLQLSRASPPVSHLLFADDSLFFCKEDVNQCKEIIDILRLYGEASGQQINFLKSSIMFGKEVSPQVKEDIKRVLGIPQEGGIGSYLGLPEKFHGSKAQVLSFIQERLNSKINAWSAKFLSKGGKEILIKSVAQALPTYVMSCFLLPKYIVSKLTSAIARFWWSKKHNERGIHWMAWNKVSIPLAEGGLGFRSLEDFNLALLAKQLWRLLRFPNSLLARVLRGRYFRYSNPLHVKPASNPSLGWRSILVARPLLLSGLRRVIGSGLSTKVWLDPWIPDIPARIPKNLEAEINPQLYVNDLIDKSSKQWKVDELKKIFLPEDIPLILGLKPSSSFSVDSYSWSYTKSGAYSVRSGYLAAKARPRGVCDLPFQGPSVVALQAQAWKLPTSRKLMHLVWQTASGCIPSCLRLMERHIGQDKACPRCGAEEESINHVFFECPLAQQTWALSLIPTNPTNFPTTSVFSNLDFLFWRVKELGVESNIQQMFPWILWFIWKARNLKVFENIEIPPNETLKWAEQEAESFRVANVRAQAVNLVTATQPRGEEPSAQVGESFPVSQDGIVCFIDGSWADQDQLSGFGWIAYSGSELLHMGLRSSRRSLSPLHAELDSLIWSLRCLIQLQIFQVNIKTDCKDLIGITNSQEDWPSFASELHEFHNLSLLFTSFSINYVSRTFNGRADLLSKKARARGLIFSHVSSQSPEWFSLEENRILKA